MLQYNHEPDQKSIIYKRNGKVISRITYEDLSKLPLGILQHIVFQSDPKPGMSLSIPMPDGKILSTTPAKMVRKEGNIATYLTKNSKYDIEFNMNLEKILDDKGFLR